MEASLPGAKPRAVGNFAGQLWSFAVAMKHGDLVVLPRKLTSQIAIGRVTGPYRYQKVGDELRHTRPVEWVRPDVSRTVFEQDLLHSFGAFMTVCNISRNDAERRVAAVLAGKADPGPSVHVRQAEEAWCGPVGARGRGSARPRATRSRPDRRAHPGSVRWPCAGDASWMRCCRPTDG